MVLQRDVPVKVWGWADAGEKVTVTLGEVSSETAAGQDGAWSVTLPAQKAADSTTLKVQGADTLTFSNVAVGDVWFCSGQSNMEWTMANCDAADDIAAADLPKIRFYRTDRMVAAEPQTDFPSGRRSWNVCTPATVAGMTGVGFYFARDVQPKAGVVIGIIDASWGGSTIEAFLPQGGVAEVPELAGDKKRFDDDIANYRRALGNQLTALEKWIPDARKALADGAAVPAMPGLGKNPQVEEQRLFAKFNAMIAPCVRYPVRGVLWYQGCSNGGEGDAYKFKMKALVDGWRDLWGAADLPFYWVQLANFTADHNQPAGGDGYAKIRMAQLEAAQMLPNTGVALAIDVGETHDIHPRNKYDVGIRLARWALRDVYGQKDLVPSGPLYTGMKVEGGAIRIAFDHVGAGLMVGRKDGRKPAVEDNGGKLARFAIAGEDQKWVWADARIDGATVVVSSPDVPAPVAVRYGFSANPLGLNLYNKDGLPASPFRTDKW
jgi:sialate O-acetylesterase